MVSLPNRMHITIFSKKAVDKTNKFIYDLNQQMYLSTNASAGNGILFFDKIGTASKSWKELKEKIPNEKWDDFREIILKLWDWNRFQRKEKENWDEKEQKSTEKGERSDS